VVRDHWEVVLVGIIKHKCELMAKERDKFFDEDTPENHLNWSRNFHREEKFQRKTQRRLRSKEIRAQKRQPDDKK